MGGTGKIQNLSSPAGSASPELFKIFYPNADGCEKSCNLIIQNEGKRLCGCKMGDKVIVMRLFYITSGVERIFGILTHRMMIRTGSLWPG